MLQYACRCYVIPSLILHHINWYLKHAETHSKNNWPPKLDLAKRFTTSTSAVTLRLGRVPCGRALSATWTNWIEAAEVSVPTWMVKIWVTWRVYCHVAPIRKNRTKTFGRNLVQLFENSSFCWSKIGVASCCHFEPIEPNWWINVKGVIISDLRKLELHVGGIYLEKQVTSCDIQPLRYCHMF